MPRLVVALTGRSLAAFGLLSVGAVQSAAQLGQRQPLAPRWEGRLEASAAEAPGAHLGVGIGVRSGWYARPSLTLAAGAVRGDDAVWRGSQRGDLVLRVLLDPFGERRRGWYGGAGVSVQQVAGRSRGALLLLAGVEGQARRGMRPAIELGVGGGVRLGVVLRRVRPDTR